jgi:hypothetical protein
MRSGLFSMYATTTLMNWPFIADGGEQMYGGNVFPAITTPCMMPRQTPNLYTFKVMMSPADGGGNLHPSQSSLAVRVFGAAALVLAMPARASAIIAAMRI